MWTWLAEVSEEELGSGRSCEHTGAVLTAGACENETSYNDRAYMYFSSLHCSLYPLGLEFSRSILDHGICC